MKKIGIFKGSFYRAYLEEKFYNQINIIEYPYTQLAFRALINNDVDVLLLASIEEDYWIANSEFEMSDFRFIGKPITLGNGYAIIANIQLNQLIAQINQVLMNMESDGTYMQMYNMYFGSMNQAFTATSLQK